MNFEKNDGEKSSNLHSKSTKSQPSLLVDFLGEFFSPSHRRCWSWRGHWSTLLLVGATPMWRPSFPRGFETVTKTNAVTTWVCQWFRFSKFQYFANLNPLRAQKLLRDAQLIMTTPELNNLQLAKTNSARFFKDEERADCFTCSSTWMMFSFNVQKKQNPSLLKQLSFP